MAEQTFNTIIVLRHDDTAAWENSTYELRKGEVGIEFTADGKAKVKIGVGGKKWSELPYFGGEEAHVDAHVYEATAAKGADHLAAIAAVVADDVPNTHDVAIVKEELIAANLLSETVTQKYQHTAYRWNGTTWTAFDGNYSAKNVIFDEDFTFTTKIGTVQTLTNGSTTVPAAGKSVKDFFAGIFAAEEKPSRLRDTAVSFSTTPSATVEVGTNVTPSYTASLSAGEYSYGPPTGITAATWEVSIKDTGESAKSTNSGSFATFQVIDGMSGYAKVTAKATYNNGAIPVTNIGNEYDKEGTNSVRFMADSRSKTANGYTSYRTWFYGYKADGDTLDIANLTSDMIRQDDVAASARTFTRANGSFTTSMTTNKMQQMLFAAPAGIVESVRVVNAINGSPQTVSKTTVYIKGANGYVTADAPNGMAYDLFYVSMDNADSGETTYTITTTNA